MMKKPGNHELILLATTLLSVFVVIWIIEPDISKHDDPSYTRDIPDFKAIAVTDERKKVFFEYFMPLIKKENQTIRETRQKLMQWYQSKLSINNKTASKIQKIAAEYKLDDFDVGSETQWKTLLRRVDAIPPSLALAQAANESAWGTSRFARKVHNYYGQWCYKRGCGLVPARRDENKTHEVAAFKSPQESVRKYIHNLNTNAAYKSLREVRSKLSAKNKPITGLDLAAGLGRYSERGKEYIEELRSMISYNKLTRFDTG